jgi:Flp pilus assembly pilin Flp
MRKIVCRFAAAPCGAVAVEYALIAMGVVLVIVASVAFTGAKLNNTYGEILAGFQ